MHPDQISMVETITWRHAELDPPDSDTTVMVSIAGGTEPTWLGWHDAGVWHDATTGAPIDGLVVSWAEPPEGWFPSFAEVQPDSLRS